MVISTYALSADGLEQFSQLCPQAIETVTARFYAVHGAEYARFGKRGQKACREDLGFHLDFLSPVLEFGFLQPYLEYLRWFTEVLAARNIPSEHLSETLSWLGEFFKEHISGSDGEIIATALAAALSQLKDCDQSEIDPSPVCKWPEQDQFETALLNGDRRQAVDIVSRLREAGHTLIEIEVDLIQITLYKIGLKWKNNEISIAREHLATATAQAVMADGFLKTQLPPYNGQKVILACVEGNDHVVGLRMIADAFELSGWEVLFLGSSVPTHALVEEILEWKPNLVGLSIAFPSQLIAARDQQFPVSVFRLILNGSINGFRIIQ